ncbi:MAG: hypothetical protein CMK83_13335 [Pseudomonadales bacterium]|jgi:4-hydroxy-tetrahydrodipicolinate synthase|uniref:dihydrodipicolinate synthase family protein n=1 Tax=unclassified Ketobacter TaxID=2639109 RepID=UPI000C5F3C78|nr:MULTISPECIES: dihydrodipicolinate synthase family protein [unclassified Ketobacter]MAA60020.1 hypothetical protein [Pseudomonadales bacterium]MEC8812637.1 dihydrodipicolinate synthase family protein [Pseudomonadota bacterium]TNC85230.1 MAG: hypothetical protein CSH49_18110 [Alcanivorax sp.]HBO92773.1 hypothetical protein [Gammaproteobacteria bacterium]MAQ25187.1 hypothetical protein [Pseudomonadales bacterium]|tara:strand:+ start:362 stop:1195 length:834 start_codon:yes stop_codon:yes gene_type:complete
MFNKDVFIPLITPFTPQGDVCRHSVRQLMQQLQPHATGFVPCLTSGEGWLLSPSQWQDMVSYCVEFAAGKPVIAGIERPSTSEVITYADEAARLGATGIIFTAPFYPDLPQAAIYNHFVQVHDQTELDIHVYFESELCRNKWEVDTLLTLCALPRVVAIKESNGEEKLAPHLRNIRRMGVKVYQGWEDKLLQYDHDGVMASYCNLDPGHCAQVINHRDYGENTLLVERCRQQGIFEPDWYKRVKTILFQQGVIATDLTLDALQEAKHHAHASTPVSA